MPAVSESIVSLPPLQRRMAEAWLSRFEENWHDQKLRECMRALPPQSSLRRPLLLAMIERDLAHQWKDGRSASVQDYLEEYPELGSVEDLPIELLATEYRMCGQFGGGGTLAEFAERYPTRAEELQLQLQSEEFNAAAAEHGENKSDLTASRLPKLQETRDKSAEAEVITKRRLELLRSMTAAVSAPTAPAVEPQPLDDPMSQTIPTPIQPIAGLTPSKLIPAAPAVAARVVEPIADSWQTLPVAPNQIGHLTKVANQAPVRTSLGRYRIDSRLGRSESGSVYQGFDTTIDRRVVLKVPSFQGPDAENERAKFHQEARLAARVQHPLLCPILDVGEIDGVGFLAMPFVEGESLQDQLRQRPIWSVRASVDLVIRLAAAFEAAHRHGVVHRDLKPSNIIMSTAELPTVVGFGHWTRPDHTLAGDNAGFVAPEQAAGRHDLTGARSDVFSLGAILYRLLTGQPPVNRDGVTLAFPPDMNPSMQQICLKAMAPQPDGRYANMREFAQELSVFRETLASDSGTRLSMSASGARRPDPLPNGTPPANSITFARMQQLRSMTSGVMPGVAPPLPLARRSYLKWFLIGAGAVAVAITALIIYNRQKNKGDELAAGQSLPAPVEPASNSSAAQSGEPTSADLVRALAGANANERSDLADKIRQRNDRETVAALAQFVGESTWAGEADNRSEPRTAALELLKHLNPDRDQVLIALKQAMRSTDSRIRVWAFREVDRVFDSDNTSVIAPLILSGLKDVDPEVRRLAAELIDPMRMNDATVVNALVARVSDSVWGETGQTTHNPRRDGGKNAALDSLEKLAPDRVAAALRSAAASTNNDVRQWAEKQRRDRSK